MYARSCDFIWVEIVDEAENNDVNMQKRWVSHCSMPWVGKARCQLSKSWLSWPAAVTALKLYYLTHLQYIISLPFSFLHKRVGVPLLIVLIKFMMANDCSALCLIVPLRDSVRSCPAIRALHSARWGVARLSYDETWCVTSLIRSETQRPRKTVVCNIMRPPILVA